MAKGVIEVTGRIEIEIVGDRLHATVPSGEKHTTYSIRFNLARGAATDALKALGEHQVARVFRLHRKGPPGTHG